MSQRQQVRLMFLLSLLLAVGIGGKWWFLAGPGRTSVEWVGAPVVTTAQAAAPLKPSDPTPPIAATSEADEQDAEEVVDLSEASMEPDPPKSNMINVNLATQEELESLPGIGPVIARAIIEERTRRGGFDSIEELLAVKGIGPARFARIQPLVYVTPFEP